MKKYIKTYKSNQYWLTNEHNDLGLSKLLALLVDFSNDLSLLKEFIQNDKQGILGNAMEIRITQNFGYIKSIYQLEEPLKISLNILNYLIDRWQELIQLKPDSITISEESGQYSISAEFNAPNELVE